MREFTLNMLSHADRVKGQGVLSAYLEELHLLQEIWTKLKERTPIFR